MLISSKYQFVFFSTPKCASVAIEWMLKPYSSIHILGTPQLRHTDYREYRQYIEPFLRSKIASDRLESVCLVREPLSWLYSWYRFRSRDELRDPSSPLHHNCTAHVNFEQFIEAYISPTPPPFADVRSQFEFVRDERGRCGIDKLFLYETIEDFVQYMTEKVDAQLSLEAKNVSPRKKQRITLASWASRIIKQRTRTSSPVVPPAIDPQEYSLPSDLLASLKKHSKDFQLYELAKSQRYQGQALIAAGSG